MWRIQSISGRTVDSDQSISDEDEEQECSWPQKCVSLAGTLDSKKETRGVASQLELLKGFHQLHLAFHVRRKTSKCGKLNDKIIVRVNRLSFILGFVIYCIFYWKDVGFSSEDEVEIPEFHNQNNVNRQCFVDSDSISPRKDDPSFEPDQQFSGIQKRNKHLINNHLSDTLNLSTRGKEKQTENFTQSAISKDSPRLVPSTATARGPTDHPLYLKEKNSSKGGRQKNVAGPSSHSEPYKIGALWSLVQTDNDLNSTSSDELLDDFDAINSWPDDKIDHFEDSHDGKTKSGRALPVRADVQHDDSRSSMIELLDHLKRKNSKPRQKFEMVARRKERIRCDGVIRNLPLSRDNLMSDEDAGEDMNSGSSTDTEVTRQNSKPVIVGPGMKTMADKFQDAFGAAPSVLDRISPLKAQKPLCTGLHGRLQQVMQRQKEQDAEFLKKQQIEVWPKDEARCIDVKILSRSFDAKLTVCHCSLLENEESSVQKPQQEYFHKTWTIIFNGKVCGDVDLEVGNLIRVHPPWKEVQVLRCGEIIILATYFSQV